MLILVRQPCNIRDSFVRLRPAMLRDDSTDPRRKPISALNVLGERLEICSFQPLTGFYRDGCCNTGQEDVGSHTVCVVMTAGFLEFSKSRGNDYRCPCRNLAFRALIPATVGAFALHVGKKRWRPIKRRVWCCVPLRRRTHLLCARRFETASGRFVMIRIHGVDHVGQDHSKRHALYS